MCLGEGEWAPPTGLLANESEGSPGQQTGFEQPGDLFFFLTCLRVLPPPPPQPAHSSGVVNLTPICVS